MGPSPRLPDLTLADAGRSFVMRPGSVRTLILPPGSPPAVRGPVSLVDETPGQDDESGTVRRYRLEGLGPGLATIRWRELEWSIEVRRPGNRVEQTRDDTDQGWGDAGSDYSRTWWEEQRPPHW